MNTHKIDSVTHSGHLPTRAACVLAIFMALFLPSVGNATTSCATTVIVTTNTSLTDDYTTNSSSAPCFEVRQSADLNLNGHSITCTSSGCSTAVKCTGASNVVRSSVTSDGAHVDISGPFTKGTENCNSVKDLVIDGAATGVSSLSNADVVSGNRVQNCTTTCIDAAMSDNTDNVRNNYVDSQGGTGIKISGRTTVGLGPDVDHNYIRRYATGIKNADSTYFRYEDNVLVEGNSGSTSIDVGANGAPTNNVCESTGTHCACAIDSLDAPDSCLF